MASEWFANICEARQALDLITAITSILCHGGERERRGRRGERSWFQSHALRRDQKDACRSTLTQVFQTELLSTHQKRVASQTSSTIPRLSWCMSWEGPVSQNRNKWCWEEGGGRQQGRLQANRTGGTGTQILQEANPVESSSIQVTVKPVS